MNKLLDFLAIALAFAAILPTAQAAEGFHQLLEGGKVSGNIRLYHFTRTYDNDNLADTHAFALAGKVKAETGSVHGFSGAIAYYFANDLGFNNHEDNDKHLTTALMGNGRAIDTIGEAYLQYQGEQVLVRAGRQSLDTPWINASDAMAVPNLYEGVSAAVTPLTGLRIEANRVWGYKNRTSSGFDRKTLLAATSKPKAAFESSSGCRRMAANTVRYSTAIPVPCNISA